MYIRKSKERKSGKIYESFRLVESIRIDNKPRQRTLLNLGSDFSLPVERHKELCGIIEEKLFLVDNDPFILRDESDLDSIADSILKKIIAKESEARKGSTVCTNTDTDIVSVDLNTLESSDIRSFGGEAVSLEMMNRLGIPKKLTELGFNRKQQALAIGSIVARLLSPGSDRASFQWLQGTSALGELIDFDFNDTSLSRFYESADQLYLKKENLEDWLYQEERQMFSLEESIILYDLTNTYFEGSGKYNDKAKFGRSKEKRTDAPLVTMGLVLDGQGFPRKSEVLPGNVSEPSTLEEMLTLLIGTNAETRKRTVVMDAGIATQDNLDWLESHGFKYVVVARNKIEMPEQGEFVPVAKDKEGVKAKLVRNEETSEWDLYVDSEAKAKKEESIKLKSRQRFEEDMEQVRASLHKKRGTKVLTKIYTRIGRVKERHRRVSGLYNIKVIPDADKKNAVEVTWELQLEKEKKKLNGIYRLRTNEDEITVEAFWKIYVSLTQVESSFRSMKSELGIRPIHHQKGRRVDAHLFITLLAYHISHSIRYQLQKSNISHSWETIRKILSGHMRVTTTMKGETNNAIHIRKNSRSNPGQKKIYNALEIWKLPGKVIKAIFTKKKK